MPAKRHGGGGVSKQRRRGLAAAVDDDDAVVPTSRVLNAAAPTARSLFDDITTRTAAITLALDAAYVALAWRLDIGPRQSLSLIHI